MSCNDNLPRYCASELLRGIAKVQQNGEVVVYEAVVPVACNASFRVGSSIGSQRPGLARAILRQLHPDPYQEEEKTKARVRGLRTSGSPIEYTTVAGLEISPLDLQVEQPLTPYAEAEGYVADALATGLIYGMHFPDEAERANAQEIERRSALEPEARTFKSGEERNAWALMLVDTWQKQHGILLAAQELGAVWSEHADAIESDALTEQIDPTTFIKMSSKSRKFRANMTFLADVKGAPEVWEAVGRSFRVGYCMGAGWAMEDTAWEYVHYTARVAKRSMKSGKSRKFGWLFAFFTVPLPDDRTVERAYLAVLWQGTRYGAEQHNNPALAARATTEHEALLAS